MNIKNDSITRLRESLRDEREEMTRLRCHTVEKFEASQRRIQDIRMKAQLAMWKVWNKRWGNED
ncbi:hypothetical protein IV102_36035 [bacterium]|nr:hypothetical protein [bacterium]